MAGRDGADAVLAEVPVELEVVRAGNAEDGVDTMCGKGFDDGGASVAVFGHELDRQHRKKLICHVRRSDARDLRMVVGRRDLHDVSTDHIGADQTSQAVQQLPAGHAARFRGPGAGGVRRVEHIDIDRDIDRAVPESGPHPLDHGGEPVDLEVVGADHLETEHLVIGEVCRCVERSPNADVQAVFGIEQSFLAGPAERGAVGERRTEVGIPGVQVGIEVQHRDRTVVSVQRSEQRQRDGVVAAEGDELGAALAQLVGCALDRGDGLGDVERVHRDVTGVGDLMHRERLDVEARVVRPQQLGCGADVLRAEAGPWPVRDSGVERDADQGDVGVGHLVRTGQARERGRPRIARHLGGIDGTNRLL